MVGRKGDFFLSPGRVEKYAAGRLASAIDLQPKSVPFFAFAISHVRVCVCECAFFGERVSRPQKVSCDISTLIIRASTMDRSLVGLAHNSTFT